MSETGEAGGLDATIMRYPGVLSPQECDRIIEASRPYGQEHIPDGGGLMVAHPIDDVAERVGEDVMTRLWHIAAHVNHVNGWGITFDIGRAGVTRYRTGDFMALHVDDHERQQPPWDIPHRGVSMSVPLSAGHVGGRLRLRAGVDDWVTPTAGRGDAVVFGSSVPHEVTAVTEGERWVLLFWAYTNHDIFGVR